MRALRSSSAGCQVLVAHSTTEALDYLFHRSAFEGSESPLPDVIVTDLKIATCGGAALVSQIRASESTRLIPIVVLSGGASAGEINDLYQRGANSFLEKPTDHSDFSDYVVALAGYWGSLNLLPRSSAKSPSFPYLSLS